ncbi:uncharacterized protein YjiS (DUF1127 family) [Dongia mobilis]|uniref:Uncharacterized protein YjiS (DUF1127 family) n=1 Tax=Dongia mobilis TaxID=578943 RepID=A0A4R6WT12_9PROT|nr:DUF1127 domain-containing protein [Dongia mobilis]TDQ86396.1 uncharacterized protein YjiS (DUF1127 family) [Dongia mobilis]
MFTMSTPAGRNTAALAILARIFARLLAMRERARQRRQLAGLSDALLKDIGISRADAEREATQPFWRV